MITLEGDTVCMVGVELGRAEEGEEEGRLEGLEEGEEDGKRVGGLVTCDG